ncbi:MAG: DUF1302 family protein [Halioglobus sp.]
MKKKLLALSVLAAVSSQANAFQFDTGDDWAIRWDTTFKGNIMARTEKPDDQVVTPKSAHTGTGWWLADDGDLAVDRSGMGLVSTRLDILTEMDVVYKGDFGFRISAAGWYDPMYGDDSDHPRNRIRTWGQPSVSPGEYNDEAEKWHYLGAEVLDAFVFANFNIGDIFANLRAGRHTIYWGNSLLAVGAINGFGGSMAPLDFNKGLAVPGSEAKELFLPTGKVSTVIQLTDNLTLNAYYNWEHRRYRLPESGTFWAPITGLTAGSEFTVFPPPGIGEFVPTQAFRPGYRGHRDEDDAGDWGINFQYYIEPWALETSFIYINYVDKNLHGVQAGADFNVAFPLFTGAPIDQIPFYESPADWDDGAKIIGHGYWNFKNDIDLWGVSFAKEIAGISFGLDVVYRGDTGLAQGLGNALQRMYNVPVPAEGAIEGLGFAIIPTVPGKTGFESLFAADSDNFQGPVGDVWSVVINGLGLLSDNGFWEGGSWILEGTFAMLDSCNENCYQMDVRVSEDRVVSHVAGVFRPTWYQVFPGTDLTVPMSLSYVIDGEKSPFTFGGDEEGGTFSIGAELLVNQAWTIRTDYNHRFGPVMAGIGGLLKDRDNVSLTIKRTF